MRPFSTPGARLVTLLVAGFGLAVGCYAWILQSVAAAGTGPIDPGEQALIAYQIVVGLSALFLSGWIWALRPDDTASRLFFASGLSTVGFTFGAALFLPSVYGQAAWVITFAFYLNFLGAAAFGCAMIALFLVYPVRIPGWRWLAAAVSVFFLGWTVAALVDPSISGHTVNFVQMVCICAMTGVQFAATRGNPRGRAVLIWLGSSVLIGAGSFIMLVAAPITFGYRPVVPAAWSFGLFLIIYAGVAAGLRRYRLFELGEWAFRFLFYALGGVLLIALDAALIFFLSVNQITALSVALLAAAFVYLPLRDVLFRRLMRRKALSEQDLFRAVIEVAFEPSQSVRPERWVGLWRTLFDPLNIHTATSFTDDAVVEEDGAEMIIPAVAGQSGLRLHHPWRGTGLFGPRHVRLAQQVIELMRQAEEGRRAYDRGVAEERVRIARDMHDNIGAQLLGALHSAEPERKNTMIRETLTDLREIINNAPRAAQDFDEALADLRAESSERLAAANVTLRWSLDGDAPPLAPHLAHTLRSIVREAVSNVIKHAGASEMSIQISAGAQRLSVDIRDNGHGFDAAAVKSGHGLANLKSRVDGVGGDIAITPGPDGTSVRVRLPMEAVS